MEIVTQQKKQPSRQTVALSEPVYICASQAMDHWAVFLARLPHPAPKTVRIPTFQPEQGMLPLTLEQERREKIEGVACTCYRFEGPGFKGRLWIDAKGRLRRYAQGNLEIILSTT